MSDKATGAKIGAGLGTAGGALVGSVYGGPVGGFVGGTVGGTVGNLLGGGIGSLFGGSDGPSPEQLAYLNALKQQEADAYARQTGLANTLQATANGQGPSVAGLQLGQGLDMIDRNAMTSAAGATGNGGVLARYGAMQAAAGAAAQTQQQAAIARAAEIAHAQTTLGNVLGNQATEGTSQYNATTGNTNAANTNSINLQKNNEDFETKLLGSGLNGYAQYKAANSSGAPSATPSYN